MSLGCLKCRTENEERSHGVENDTTVYVLSHGTPLITALLGVTLDII